MARGARQGRSRRPLDDGAPAALRGRHETAILGRARQYSPPLPRPGAAGLAGGIDAAASSAVAGLAIDGGSGIGASDGAARLGDGAASTARLLGGAAGSGDGAGDAGSMVVVRPTLASSPTLPCPACGDGWGGRQGCRLERRHRHHSRAWQRDCGRRLRQPTLCLGGLRRRRPHGRGRGSEMCVAAEPALATGARGAIIAAAVARAGCGTVAATGIESCG